MKFIVLLCLIISLQTQVFCQIYCRERLNLTKVSDSTLNYTVYNGIFSRVFEIPNKSKIEKRLHFRCVKILDSSNTQDKLCFGELNWNKTCKYANEGDKNFISAIMLIRPSFTAEFQVRNDLRQYSKYGLNKYAYYFEDDSMKKLDSFFINLTFLKDTSRLLGNKKNIAQNINIFPNPNKGIFQIQFDHSIDCTIAIFSPIGKKIIEKKLKPLECIKISNIGLYSYILKNEKNKIIKSGKIIITD